MIVQIRGRLIRKEPGSVVVEANGLGYQVFVSLTTFYEIPDLEQTVILHTHTHVREDALQLFGFSSPLEKELFQILIGGTGIGPKLALNILSGSTPEELLHSFDRRDIQWRRWRPPRLRTWLFLRIPANATTPGSHAPARSS